MSQIITMDKNNVSSDLKKVKLHYLIYNWHVGAEKYFASYVILIFPMEKTEAQSHT